MGRLDVPKIVRHNNRLYFQKTLPVLQLLRNCEILNEKHTYIRIEIHCGYVRNECPAGAKSNGLN